MASTSLFSSGFCFSGATASASPYECGYGLKISEGRSSRLGLMVRRPLAKSRSECQDTFRNSNRQRYVYAGQFATERRA